MAYGDISNIEYLGAYSTKTNPFLAKDVPPHSGGYIDVTQFKSLNTNKKLDNTIMYFWDPKRDKAEFKFPYKNLFELIQHSGTQSGYLSGETFLPMGEYETFATSGDLINAGFDPELAQRFGYKYTSSGAKIGYNEIYIEGNATLDDLIGKTVNCIMISRFSSSGIVSGEDGYKRKKQKIIHHKYTRTGFGSWSGANARTTPSSLEAPGFLRYMFFITTGDLLSGQSIDNNRYAYLSVGPKCTTINYPQVATGNNENYYLIHSGISGQELYGNFYVGNSGNYAFGVVVNSLDDRIIIDKYSPTGFRNRAGDPFATRRRKRDGIQKSINYKINTVGLEVDNLYTGYIRVSGAFAPPIIPFKSGHRRWPRNPMVCNITGLNLPVYYKIYDTQPKAYFDNFYFKFNGPGLNDFTSYPIGTPIDCSGTGIYRWKYGSYITGYPKIKLGLTIYNTGQKVSGSYSLNKINSGWFKPSMDAQLYWDATGSDYIWTFTRWGGVSFKTGESGDLPSQHYIPYQMTSGAFCNDIYFSITNTGQFSTGLFSGDLCVKTSDPEKNEVFFPILINYL